MFEIMKSLHIDWKDMRLLQDLYRRQEAVVLRVGGDPHPGELGRGFRQGFPISSLLFSIYADVMMIEALEDMKEQGRSIAVKQLVGDVRFADDQGVMAGTEM